MAPRSESESAKERPSHTVLVDISFRIVLAYPRRIVAADLFILPQSTHSEPKKCEMSPPLTNGTFMPGSIHTSLLRHS